MDRRRLSVSETGRWNFKAEPVDMTGERHGRLVMLRRVESDGVGRARWLCRCDCGSEVVRLRQVIRESGDKSSCGCLKAEACRELGRRSAGRPKPQRMGDIFTLLSQSWQRPQP